MLASTVFFLCASAALTLQAEVEILQNKTLSDKDGISMRIVDGFPAKSTNQFPFMAYIETIKYSQAFRCSGALIATRWVITAAHCIENGQEFHVYLGTVDANYYKNNHYKASRVEVHPNYYHKRDESVGDIVLNDIALLYLSQNVILSNSISIINLYPRDVGPGAYVIGMGYGERIPGTPETSGQLRYATLQTISIQECARFYSHVLKNKGYLCAKAVDGMTCGGDSGSPLVYNNGGQPVVVGVVSVGFVGCGREWPDAFTKIVDYIPWIQEKINGRYY